MNDTIRRSYSKEVQEAYDPGSPEETKDAFHFSKSTEQTLNTRVREVQPITQASACDTRILMATLLLVAWIEVAVDSGIFDRVLSDSTDDNVASPN